MICVDGWACKFSAQTPFPPSRNSHCTCRFSSTLRRQTALVKKKKTSLWLFRFVNITCANDTFITWLLWYWALPSSLGGVVQQRPIGKLLLFISAEVGATRPIRIVALVFHCHYWCDIPWVKKNIVNSHSVFWGLSNSTKNLPGGETQGSWSIVITAASSLGVWRPGGASLHRPWSNLSTWWLSHSGWEAKLEKISFRFFFVLWPIGSQCDDNVKPIHIAFWTIGCRVLFVAKSDNDCDVKAWFLAPSGALIAIPTY